MSAWNRWSDEDRGYALALDIVEAEQEAARKAATCPVCGGLRAECADKNNQHAFEVDGGWCYRTKALVEFQDRQFGDSKKGRIAAAASVIIAKLNPAKRKEPRHG